VPRLDEFNRDEWYDVARILRPDWTEEDFDREWKEFQAAKAEHERKARLQ
jgi:hypothetical protein